MSLGCVRREFAKQAIDAAVRKALRAGDDERRSELVSLLWRVQSRSTLLSPAGFAGREPSGMPEVIVQGLAALVDHRDDWLQPVERWRPEGRKAVGVFSSLAHHLLARYPVPAVLLSAWFRTDREPARRAQGWFRHVGLGGSLRTAGLPLTLTRRGMHLFANARPGRPIEFALRQAQVRGLGGGSTLALFVASTRLGSEFEAPEFWDPILARLVRSRRISMSQVTPLVDFLHHQRSEQPEFTVPGGSIESLARDAEAWADERRRQEARRVVRWSPSGIGALRRPDAEGRDWSIRELLGSEELTVEGRVMRNCVALYKEICEQGTSAIWSLRCETPQGLRRLATVEVDLETRVIVQARARCNTSPDAAVMAFLADWAKAEGLTIEL